MIDRPHLWPHVAILFTGIFVILFFMEGGWLLIGLALSIAGSCGLFYHLAVDEHVRM